MISRYTFIAKPRDCRQVSCSRRCTVCNSLHLHAENRLRFSDSHIFFTEDRQTAFILARWFLKAMQHMGSWITISFGVRGFLLSFSSSFALNFKPPFLSVAWKPKNAPRREVRLNDVNWSLVATSPLGNSEYQTERNMTKWEQNRNPLAILALRARPKF